jgi:hypothetical protein
LPEAVQRWLVAEVLVLVPCGQDQLHGQGEALGLSLLAQDYEAALQVLGHTEDVRLVGA